MVAPRFHLRDVRLDDVDVYVRMRCDPVMTAELGGPYSPNDVPAKVREDVAASEAGDAWILMVVPEGARDVAGSVVVWTNDKAGDPYSEIGWMILPEYQRQGLATAAVRAVLEREHQEARWGPIHAYPGVTNKASNGVCRACGFDLLGTETTEFRGSSFTANHWVIDPREPPRARP